MGMRQSLEEPNLKGPIFKAPADKWVDMGQGLWDAEGEEHLSQCHNFNLNSLSGR